LAAENAAPENFISLQCSIQNKTSGQVSLHPRGPGDAHYSLSAGDLRDRIAFNSVQISAQ
jgi:hypothetical protein